MVTAGGGFVVAENENSLESKKVPKSDVKIADEVIGSIAGLAASDVEGVVSMAGSDISSIFGKKSAKRGVKEVITDDRVSFKLSLIVEYGCNIPEVCAKVQEKVKNTVENMTGLHVDVVEVTISGIVIPES